ncbi:DNA invertase Pin-like site-specific DNA recombinase [Sphingomonas sp. SORGH_AS870]|nr:DNA invertase Pin-like site-specific DNA recombinase [Sphingomonas sp. SORGH_AS_0870]
MWKLDRLGRDLRHLANLVGDLTKRGIALKVLAGEGAAIDTTTANGRPVFAIFAGLAEFGRERRPYPTNHAAGVLLTCLPIATPISP